MKPDVSTDLPLTPPDPDTRLRSGRVTLLAASWSELHIALFRCTAGREARWTLRADGTERVLVGRIPIPRRWPAPDDPCLLLPPGSTDGVHVLAEMALHLRLRNGVFFLARRKWYEAQDLDWIRLGREPLVAMLEVVESR